jgi:hypothetical protein
MVRKVYLESGYACAVIIINLIAMLTKPKKKSITDAIVMLNLSVYFMQFIS